MEDARVGEEAVRRGFITASQLEACRKIVEAGVENGLTLGLTDTLLRNGFLTPEQVELLKGPSLEEAMAAPLAQAADQGGLPAAPRQIGPYEILEEIGQGASGAVYTAKKSGQDRVVALRVLPEGFAADETAVEKFKRESKPKVALHHPNLVKYLAFGLSGRNYFAAMEFAEGMPLPEYLLKNGPQDEKKVIQWALQLVGALRAIQAAGLAHGEVRPERVRIDSAGNARLMELGVTGELPTFSVFRAPEENRRDMEIDARAEIYSLGAILYFMLAGAPPFEGATGQQDILARQTAGAPDPLEKRGTLGSPIRQLVLRLLDPDPAARFGSLEAVRSELEEMERGPVVNAVLIAPAPKKRPAAVPAKPAGNPVKKWVLVGVGGALGFIAIMVTMAKLSGPSASGPVAAPSRPVISDKPDVARQISALIAEERFAEAAKLAEQDGVSETDQVTFRLQVRDAASASLNSLKSAVAQDLSSGAFAAARQKVEQFRPKVAGLADATADLNRQAAQIDAQEEQGQVRAAEEEHARLVFAIQHLVDAGQFDDAIRACRDVINRNVQNPRAVKRIQERIQALEKQKETYVKKEPGENPTPGPAPAPDSAPTAPSTPNPARPGADVSKPMERARAAVKAHQIDQALDAVNEALKIDPNHPDALALRARCKVDKGRFQDALEDANRALAAKQNSADALYAAGAITQSALPLEAVNFLTKAIQIQPDFAAAYLRRAECQVAVNHYDDALKDAAEAAKLDPSIEVKREASRIRVEAYRKLGNVDKALAECEAWVRLDPKDARALVARADLHQKKGHAAEARRDLQAALKLDAKDAETKARLAELDKANPKPAAAKGDHDRREQVKKKLLETFSGAVEQVEVLEDGRVRFGLGYDFSNTKQFDDFQTAFANRMTGGIQIRSQDHTIKGLLVWTHKLKGDFTARVEYLVEELNEKEITAVVFRTSTSGDIDHVGDGIGSELASTTAWDPKEWKFILIRQADKPEILTNEANPALVRHNAKERVILQLQRAGKTYTARYGQSPPISVNAEGPDSNFLRLFCMSGTIKVVKFEVQGTLDPEYVNQLVPPAGEAGAPVPDNKPAWTPTGLGKAGDESGQIVIDAVENDLSLVYEKQVFEDKATLQMKFQADLVGAFCGVGMGIVARGSSIPGPGNFLLLFREDNNSPQLVILRHENGGWAAVQTQAIKTSLKPGAYALTLEIDGETAKLTLDGGESVSADIGLKGPFKFGMWVQKGKVHVLEVGSK